jgi:hypothetical protein
MFNAEHEKEMEDEKEGRMVRFAVKHNIKLEMKKNINI